MRAGIRRAVAGAALPYGFTVVIWTSGGVLIGTHGPPSELHAFFFLAGAAVGFLIAALAADADDAPRPARSSPRTTGMAAAIAAAVGLGLGGAAAHALPGAGAYVVVPLLATLGYLLVLGACLTALGTG